MSVNVIIDMIVFYLTHKAKFHNTPNFNSDTYKFGKRNALNSNAYSRCNRNILKYKGKHTISLSKRTCDYRYFLKSAVCSHVYVSGICIGNSIRRLGLVRNTQIQLRISILIKKGAKKKTVPGAYKKSEKALSNY